LAEFNPSWPKSVNPPSEMLKARIPVPIKVGGLDVALRVDSTAFFACSLSKDNVMEEIALKQWPHVDPGKILNDMKIINDDEKFAIIGYDRLGTGEFIKMAHKSIPFTEVVSSMPMKYDIIGLINERFSQKKLIIHNSDLYKECTEQEKIISESGNLLYRHPQGFHDDRFWAMGMAVKAADRFLRGVTLTKIHIVTGQKPETLEERVERELKAGLA
jgi:hypothetical protein